METASGKRKLMRVDSAWTAAEKADVRKALATSNNGEDFSRFVDWVAGHEFDVVGGKLGWVQRQTHAPLRVVNALMNAQTRDKAVDIVWRHCLERMEGAVYQLRS